MFSPETYRQELEDADAVVHSMGIFFGSEKYKSLVNGEFSASKACQIADEIKNAAWNRFAGSTPGEAVNPLKRTPNGPASANVEDDLFQKINRESAVKLARAFSETVTAPETKPFVYISAEDHNLLAPAEYIHSKRLAEADLSQISNLRTVFLRPGFMVPPSSTGTIRDGIGALLKAKYNVTKMLGVEKETGSWPVLNVETVAQAAVESVGDDNLHGAIGLLALDKYARDL